MISLLFYVCCCLFFGIIIFFAGVCWGRSIQRSAEDEQETYEEGLDYPGPVFITSNENAVRHGLCVNKYLPGELTGYRIPTRLKKGNDCG